MSHPTRDVFQEVEDAAKKWRVDGHLTPASPDHRSEIYFAPTKGKVVTISGIKRAPMYFADDFNLLSVHAPAFIKALRAAEEALKVSYPWADCNGDVDEAEEAKHAHALDLIDKARRGEVENG